MSTPVDSLREIIARLRAPGGCPWDREQTPVTLIPSLLEEAYEVADAIVRGNAADLEDELGDLLINVLMQAEIAAEQGAFTLDSVAANAAAKLVRRHPHVFASSTAGTSAEVLTQWEEIKGAERAAKGGGGTIKPSLLDGVTLGLPALVRAHKIQKKAAKAGFDWERSEDVLAKVHEELLEVEAEMVPSEGESSRERLREELGDLLFAVVNLTRSLSIDAESTLREATEKFSVRFRSMEEEIPSNRHFAELSFEEMNNLWERAKLAGRP